MKQILERRREYLPPVWYADTGREFCTNPMGAVALSPDGKWLLGGRVHGGQYLCPLDPPPAALASKSRILTAQECERYEIGASGEPVPL